MTTNFQPVHRSHTAVWTILALLLGYAGRGQELRRYTFDHQQMGTQFRLIFYAGSDSLAAVAAAAAFARIDELNQRLSDYLPDSELSRLPILARADTAVGVSADLWAVLVRGQELAERSHGAFDLTIGPLTKLWRRAFRQQQFPEKERLEAARTLVGYRLLNLREDRRAVRITRPGLQLDAGGIAKGYAVDEAHSVLLQFGIRQMLIDGGGDLLAGEAPPGEPGWRVRMPSATSAGLEGDTIICLKQAALATSGDTYRFLEWRGTHYSHLIDPRSGLGVTHRALVSVGCPTALTADGLASAISIIGPRGQWRRLLRAYPDCWARIRYPAKSGKVRIRTSPTH